MSPAPHPASTVFRRLTRATLIAFMSVLMIAGTAAADVVGIDVSKWQHSTSINWASVRADGVRFVFIKATEGSTVTNAYLKSDWAGAKANGIYRGAYHFARPSIGSAAKQANFFVNLAGTHGARGDLPPVLDLESSGGLSRTQLQGWVREWLKVVENKTGRKAVIYTSPAFWEYYMGNTSEFVDHPLWVAHYGVSSPRVPGGWSDWTMWQRTDRGAVAGISGNVDINSFNGRLRKLKRMANIEVTSTTPNPPVEDQPVVDTEPELDGETSKTPSAVTVGYNRTSVFKGGKVTVTGTVKTATGEPSENRRAVLLTKTSSDDVWQKRQEVRSDESGAFEFTQKIGTETRTRVLVRKNRVSKRVYSTVQTITIRDRKNTVTVLGAGEPQRLTTSGDRSRTALTGVVAVEATGNAVKGKIVILKARAKGTSHWRTIKTATTNREHGEWRFTVSPKRDVYYRAIFEGTRILDRSRTERVLVAGS